MDRSTRWNYILDGGILSVLFTLWQQSGTGNQLFAMYMANSKGLCPHAKDLIERILANDDQTLYERSQQLNKIIGNRISVLVTATTAMAKVSNCKEDHYHGPAHEKCQYN